MPAAFLYFTASLHHLCIISASFLHHAPSCFHPIYASNISVTLSGSFFLIASGILFLLCLAMSLQALSCPVSRRGDISLHVPGQSLKLHRPSMETVMPYRLHICFAGRIQIRQACRTVRMKQRWEYSLYGIAQAGRQVRLKKADSRDPKSALKKYTYLR